jgi:hypothetical protein
MRHLCAFALLGAVLCCLSPPQGKAAEAVWTAIIPDAFPNYVYTWHMSDDGLYREDGRDDLTGKPIQSTLSGRWSREGPHMELRQDGLPFVFDGMVIGNLYGGTLYFNGVARSRFCAARGETPPERCAAAPSVAINQPVNRP